jgi:hypothetical protein
VPNLVLSHTDREVLVELIDESLERGGVDVLEAAFALALRAKLIERPNCPNSCCS